MKNLNCLSLSLTIVTKSFAKFDIKEQSNPRCFNFDFVKGVN